MMLVRNIAIIKYGKVFYLCKETTFGVSYHH